MPTDPMRDARKAGRAELAAVRRRSRSLYWSVGLFSLFVNALMLTGPLYMLNVYDRVLGSRSVETLIALSVLVAFLFAMMGVLDFVRGRVMGRVSARLQEDLDRRVFEAVLRAPPGDRTLAPLGLRDLEGVQRMVASPALMALYDLPWTPIFVAGIFIFHPWMGLLALGGGALLVLLGLANRALSREPLERAHREGAVADAMGLEMRGEAETVQSLGMTRAAFGRWQARRRAALQAAIAGSDVTGGLGSLTKTLRLFLQSAMLGLGAFLVLQGELTAGAMIAGSILLGRALAPVELLIGQWPVLQRGREAWGNLALLLGAVPEEPHRTDLPRPTAQLTAENVTVVPPGRTDAAVRGVSFSLPPGRALGIIGPSGAGKSTIARAITGVWPVTAGKIRLGGATLDRYDPDRLGRLIGYLPQRVQLFDGTIRENIARMAEEAEDAAVVAAAQAAAAHEMILALPDGYDTRVDGHGGLLSGGQLQRIGLARALFGDPVLLVLDEPNANLDNAGSTALNAAIKAHKEAGGAVLIMAHRPAAIAECDDLLVIDHGLRRAFGPKEKVLRETVQNAKAIQSGAAGGVR